jgi:hypothetical protein
MQVRAEAEGEESVFYEGKDGGPRLEAPACTRSETGSMHVVETLTTR